MQKLMDLFPVSNASLLFKLLLLYWELLSLPLFFLIHLILSITGFEFRQLVLAEKDNSRGNICFGKTIRVIAVDGRGEGLGGLLYFTT